jgi:ATP-dependent Zn protease
MPAEHDRNTAYHEAGHAVIAMFHERPVQRVSVLPKNQFLGICQFKKGVLRPSKDWLENEILISLAGVAAEARSSGKYHWDGAAGDLQVAKRLATMRAGEKQAEKLLRRLLSKVENLLADEELWQAVEWIAEELVKHGEISGRAARHFYDQAIKKD